MVIDGFDELLRPDFVEGVRSVPIEEVRAKRAACQSVESKLSYLRRLIQGRLDIVASEVTSRAGGAERADAAALVASLPTVLAEKVRAPGVGRLPLNLVPPDDDELTAELDALAGPDTMGALHDLSDGELAEVEARLAAFEEAVSAQRRAIFGVIDDLEGELGRRYQQGEADPSSLLD